MKNNPEHAHSFNICINKIKIKWKNTMVMSWGPTWHYLNHCLLIGQRHSPLEKRINFKLKKEEDVWGIRDKMKEITLLLQSFFLFSELLFYLFVCFFGSSSSLFYCNRRIVFSKLKSPFPFLFWYLTCSYTHALCPLLPICLLSYI